MSQFADLINQFNQLTGYNVPTASGIVISQSANPVGSGSVNQIVGQINDLSGYSIPSTQVQFVSGTNVAGPIIIYTPYAAGGTISTEGILPGRIIRAEHVLRIINALNGVNVNDIIISGSFTASGSNTLNGTLSLPFIPNNKILITSGGFVVGTDTAPTASYANTASFAITASYALNIGYNYTASFIDSPTWVIHHGLNNRIVMIQAYNTNFQQIIPQTIELTDENTATITFPKPYSGFAVASVGGAVIRSVESASYAATASYIDPKNLAFSAFQIFTGSVSASVGLGPDNIFLIKSASVNLFEVNNSGSVTMSGGLVVTGSAILKSLVTSSIALTDVLMISSSGQIFTTSSSAIGGGGATLKAGSASLASFAGTPFTSSITFGSAFSTNLYAVTVTGEDARSWTIQSKSSAGFTINSNSTVALTGPVYWIATPFN